VALACIASVLCLASVASAHPSVQTKTRVGVFEAAPALNVRLHASASQRTHPGFPAAQAEPTSGSPHAARGVGTAAELGRAGEAAAGIIKNTERIASATGTAAYRVPDVLNHSARIIGEVKNVGSLSYTSQLRDFASFARANNYTFELYVRSSTQLSGPLQQAVSSGEIVLRFLP
jgi:hypothetical protein